MQMIYASEIKLFLLRPLLQTFWEPYMNNTFPAET